MIDISEFVNMFLTGPALHSVICHMCNQNNGLAVDPITDTLTTMVSTPVVVVITEAGVAMFKDKPTMVFPYTSMTMSQIHYIRDIVQSMEQYVGQCGQHLKGQIQMGGGCILALPHKIQKHEHILCKFTVITAFIDCVRDTTHHCSWSSKATCGIILQRFMINVNLSKDIGYSATKYLDNCFAEIAV
jgi:hypothetical protein